MLIRHDARDALAAIVAGPPSASGLDRATWLFVQDRLAGPVEGEAVLEELAALSSDLRRSHRYFHGGVPGLRPGSLILPPAITGATPEGGRGGAYDPARVYVTRNPTWAVFYASYHGSCQGIAYAVEPVGDIDVDPVEHWHAHVCDAARVVAVADVPTKITLTMRLADREALADALLRRDPEFMAGAQ